MTNSHSPEWQRVQELEDLLALLSEADDHRVVIRQQAWHEGDWRRVYIEATRQGRLLARVKATLSELWQSWHELASGEEHDVLSDTICKCS